MDLSIIIVSWNTRELLQRCLEVIFYSSTQYSFDVWVIDNASTDHSASMIQNEFPHIHLIVSNENLGFAHANNLAIAQTSARYVMLLNPDTEIDRYVIDLLINYMDTHPDIGASSPKLLNPDGTLQVSSYPRPTLSREFWRLFHLDEIFPYAAYPKSYWNSNNPLVVDVLIGACLLLRGQILKQVGLLDDTYFMYTEEVDFCYRVQKAGWQLAWVPNAIVVHYGGQSTKMVRQEMFINLYRSKVIFFRKHYGELRTQLYKLILYAASGLRLAISPFAAFSEPTRRNEQMILVNNYKRLLSELRGM